MSHLSCIAPGVHVAEGPQRFFGIEVGARMTVLECEGGLLVHAPLAIDPAAVAAVGEARWVLAPNKLHHLYVGPWAETLEAWACPGLPEKRPDVAFHGVVSPDSKPFGPDVDLLPMACFSLTNEVAVLHRPSRTLVVTDLVFHFDADAPWLTRAAMFCACGYPGCQTTTLERVGMRRAVARTEVGTLLEWDFDRLIMAHGQVIETGGKQALRNAFRWLL